MEALLKFLGFGIAFWARLSKAQTDSRKSQENAVDTYHRSH
jgi:hypothetical protein